MPWRAGASCGPVAWCPTDASGVKPLVPTSVVDPLVTAAQRMLGPEIAVAGGRMSDWADALWPEEEAAVSRAVPKRRQEFAAGRSAARHAMLALGVAATALPRLPEGPPRWPAGLTGSLSHGGGHVLVAMGALGPGLRALGLDLEPYVPLPRELISEICRPDEDRSLGIRIFSAKEAAFKAQFALTGKALEPADLRIRFEPERAGVSRFTAQVVTAPDAPCLSGGQTLIGSLLLSTMRIG